MDRQGELQERFQILLQNDIPTSMAPEARLLMAILRQSVLDYFHGSPLERYGAWEYFSASPLYILTLRVFNLPDDLLPAGVEVEKIYRRKVMETIEEDPLALKRLVRELSGAQLKVLLAMGGMLPLPGSAGMIANACGLNRTTAVVALEQLEKQALVSMELDGKARTWSLPAEVRAALQEVWGRNSGRSAQTDAAA